MAECIGCLHDISFSLKGQEKKKLAIQYIVNKLPFVPLVKTIISVLLSSFIDDVVEISVDYMNSLPSIEGE